MRKIFIVAPHFPPSSLPPAQRVRLLVNHLASLGWNPTVFTVDHKYREEIEDKWMLELAGNQYSIVWVKCLDQKKARKWGVGDLALRMIPYLTGSLIKNSRKENPDFILYPVPPWYLMVIAPVVKWFTGIPYGIDFIDPWVRKIEPTDNLKARISQWIARRIEGFSVVRSSAIFAVSEGIIHDLQKRYPKSKGIPAVAVPYGVELSDYDHIPAADRVAVPGKLTIRYIGALSDSMLEVATVLLRALKAVRKEYNIYVEFIGTSYTSNNLSKSRIESIIEKYSLQTFVKEFPLRVAYKEALKLNLSADVLLLVGDMTPYYAASKLMGLIASQKPFIALVHRESFPAQFIEALNYPHVVQYSTRDNDLPEQHLDELIVRINTLLNGLDKFTPIPGDHPLFTSYTARQMTKIFTKTIEKVIV